MAIPQQLLSTTALQHMSDWSLIELRENAYLYVDQGRLQETIRFLSFLFFRTTYIHARDRNKRYLLRVVWKRINAYYQQYFCDIASDILKLAQDATDTEWAMDLVTISEKVADQLRAELPEEFEMAQNFGKADLIVGMLLEDQIILSEKNLETVASLLRV
jgi:hypothetical protein